MGSKQAPPLHTVAAWPVASGGKTLWMATPTSKVRCATWPAANPSKTRGTIMLAHGLSESMEKYQAVIAKLTQRNFSVAMTDWRGHGLSDNCPPKSKEDFNLRDADLASFMKKHVLDGKMAKPIIGMGHSFGGCLMCCAVHDHPDWFAGGVLCAPMLGIDILEKRPYLKYVALFLHFARPSFLTKRPDPNDITRFTSDANRFAQFQEFLAIHPELRPKFDLMFWMGNAQKRMQTMVKDWYQQIKVPMLLFAAEKENLIDNDAIKKASEAIPDAHFVEVKGAWHEILMEQDHIQATLWNELDEFLDRLAPKKKAK